MNRHIQFLSADKKMVSLDIKVRTLDGKHRDWETLEEVENPHELSIMGDVGVYTSGQVYDDFEPTETQRPLVEFWKKHHLNGTCAGTKAQTEALEGCKSKDYRDQCEYLDFHGLLVDRGYKYGTGWLWRPFPEEELEGILDAIEEEETARASERRTIDFDDEDEIERLYDLIDDKLGLGVDPYSVIALMMHLSLNEDDLEDIECLSDHSFCYLDDYYYSGTLTDLETIALDRIDREMWVDAVVNNCTSQGFDDWRDSWIDEDLASAVGSVDGRLHKYDVDGLTYMVCEY